MASIGIDKDVKRGFYFLLRMEKKDCPLGKCCAGDAQA
jgi:hypothetical protein